MAGVSRPETIGQVLSFNKNNNTRIEIIDHIERRRCQIESPNCLDPTAVPTEKFHFPVDRGVSITTEELSFPYAAAVPIRNHTGLMIDQLTSGDHQKFPRGQYTIELPIPIKLYILINSEFKIYVTSEHVKIEFKNPTEVFIGARSHHEHPVGQITTPCDPEDMMKAVSCLSSALKTTTCERSYPSLRGHPPEIVLGDELHIPQVVEKPETGVEIEIPPDHRSIYIISPLAYYLGANLVPGDSYKLQTAHGFTHSLEDTTLNIEEKIKKLTRKCFFLDCLTRTEGYYKTTLHERKQVEKDLDIDFKKVYQHSLPEQIEVYLDIEYDEIANHVPKWKQTAHVEITPENVEILPFLIHDLASIHSAQGTGVRSNTGSEKNTIHSSESRTIQSDDQPGLMRNDTKKRGTRSNNQENIGETKRVEVSEDNSLEQVWVGDGIPVAGSKLMLEAFKNRLEREPADGNIEVSVIVNDPDMVNEGEVVDDVYGTREQLEFSVDMYDQLSTNELQDILQTDVDFLHYIGHIDNKGFQCADGRLDVTEIDCVGVDSFLLNACSSYQQAIELITSGSIAGIATTQPILNSGAERMGESIARLLNLGFPLVAALEISKSKSLMGDNYVVIGDSGLDLTQPESGIPSLCKLEREADSFKLKYMTYLTRKRNIGTITIPYINENEEFYLTSGFTGEFSTNINELMRVFTEDTMPVKLKSRLYWSDSISIKELTAD
jgi:hypothetical protein